MNKDGERYAVYHETAGGQAWTHPYDQKCEACP